MDNANDVSDAWAAELNAFVTSEQAMLHVTVDEQTRGGVLASWYGCMKERPSGHLFFVVQAPALGARGWDLRADELTAQYHHLRQVLARTSVSIAALGDDVRPWPGRSGGLQRFATILGRVEAGLTARRAGLVIVIAPLFDVSRDATWQADIEMLASAARSLSRVRLVLTELAPGPSAAMARARRAQVCSVRLDPNAIRRAMLERLHAQASAPVGATGFRATGAAGPRVVPPPRPERTPQRLLTPEALAAINPEVRLVLDPVAQDTLRRCSALAAARAVEGDLLGAIEPQAAIVRACQEAGALSSAASNMLLLGAFTAGAGSAQRARAIYGDARTTAKRCGANSVAVQALFFLAALEIGERRHIEAANWYRQAAQSAAAMSETLMAIEGLRACGEALITCGRVADAVGTWREALAIANEADRAQAKISAASALARRLAAICRERGLHDQAREYEGLADSLGGTAKERS